MSFTNQYKARADCFRRHAPVVLASLENAGIFHFSARKEKAARDPHGKKKTAGVNRRLSCKFVFRLVQAVFPLVPFALKAGLFPFRCNRQKAWIRYSLLVAVVYPVRIVAFPVVRGFYVPCCPGMPADPCAGFWVCSKQSFTAFA